jgi:hypothetical protein
MAKNVKDESANIPTTSKGVFVSSLEIMFGIYG